MLGDDHPITLISINNMGRLLQNQGKLGEAEPYLREALEGRRRVLGDDHADTLRSIGMALELVQRPLCRGVHICTSNSNDASRASRGWKLH